MKLTPLVFVVYLGLTGRRRAAGTALATFAGAAAAGFLLAPADSVAYWFGGTFAAADRISDVAAAENHTLHGFLARLATDGGAQTVPWLAGAAVLGAATLGVARRVHRVGEEVLALTLCGLASAALAPFAWSHHWVWFVPLAVPLAGRAAAGSHAAAASLLAVLAVSAAVVTALPGPDVGPIPRSGLVSLQPDVYLLAFVAAVVVSAVWLRRARS